MLRHLVIPGLLATLALGGCQAASGPAAPLAVTVEPTHALAAVSPAPGTAASDSSQPNTGAPALASVAVQVVPIVSGLDQPVDVVNAGDGSRRLFVLERPGTIRIIQNGSLLDKPFLDITSKVLSTGMEQGLLGLAFHPQYSRNGFFFVNYIDQKGNTMIARYRVSASDPDQADPASEQPVLQVSQPAPNHNGGNLVFGPDGNLWIGLGDGGGEGDTYHNGQNRQSLLGKLLRINVDNLPYTIPLDNPFINSPDARPEVWAIGLRNPWRFSFDRQTGDLIIGDVGQNTYEEIDFWRAGSAAGLNYGWPIMEGNHCYPDSQSCDRTGLTLPVAEYTHDEGCAVTGGYVYRGSRYPALTGIYFFSDFCSGILWGMARDAAGTWRVRLLGHNSISPSSFGQDEDGELYVADMTNGVILQIQGQ